MGRVVLRPPLTCPGEEAAPPLFPWLGGKGANLARLQRSGQPVPRWYAVTTAAFGRCLERAGLAGEIESRLAGLDGGSSAAVQDASREIGERIRDVELVPELEAELRSAHERCIPPGATVAVRSSAASEDGSGASFAGLHETVLGATGPEAVASALRVVWASAFGEAALAYRLARGLPVTGIEMAVVIQRMVRPEVSGVLFTCHPTTGDPGQVVISSLYGLGSGVVDGSLAADRFVVDKAEGSVRSELASKTTALALDGDGSPGGTRQIEVAPELRDRSSLDDEQVRTLARMGAAIERRMGRPQDLEFAIDGDAALFVLQSRPVPTAGAYGPAAGNRCVWDLSNWTENYPGLSLPMTYSVARRFDRIGFHCFAELMRMSARDVREWEALFHTTLGYFQGRICSNRVNRYRFFRLIPGIDFHRRALLSLLRVRPDEVDPELESAAPGALRRWCVELPKLLKTLGGLAGDAVRVRSRVQRLLDEAAGFYRRFDEREVSEMRPHELVALYEEAERKLAWRWKAPLQNALFLRLSYVTLVRLCRTWCGDRDGSLPAELLGGEASQSVEAMRELVELAGRAREEPGLRQLLTELPPEEALPALCREPRFDGFTAALERYLEHHAERSFTEMKLEAPTLGDRPELLIGMIRAHLDGGEEARRPVAHREDRPGSGAEAERRALDAIRGSLLGGLRRLFFRWLVRRARRLDEQREEVKAARVRLMGLIRQLVRALGEELARESVLAEAGDVFYLTLEEVFDYVRGNAVTVDLRGLVALRRAQVERWKAGPAVEERFCTYGMVYHRNDASAPGPEESGEAPGAEETLRGEGCSRGRVTGRVRKADPLNQPTALRGDVLLVERIHTGWIPFLPSVSGLLVEHGEILSHCANVARELRVPMVVGVPGLMRRLRDGDRVTVDGEKGTVEVVERREAPPELATGNRTGLGRTTGE